MRHLPNLITASRGLSGFVVFFLLAVPDPGSAAFWVFVAAMLTDLFDGALARRLGTVDELGRWLDPISDKLLIDLSWLALWNAGWSPGWLSLTLIFRDLTVAVGYTGTRVTGRRFEVNHAGRLAVSFEGIALGILLFHGPWLGLDWPAIGRTLGAIALLFSLAAVGGYVRSGPRPDPLR